MIARADDASNTAAEPVTADEAEAIQDAARATAPEPIRKRKRSPFVFSRLIYDEPPFDRDSAIPF